MKMIAETIFSYKKIKTYAIHFYLVTACLYIIHTADG